LHFLLSEYEKNVYNIRKKYFNTIGSRKESVSKKVGSSEVVLKRSQEISSMKKPDLVIGLFHKFEGIRIVLILFKLRN